MSTYTHSLNHTYIVTYILYIHTSETCRFLTDTLTQTYKHTHTHTHTQTVHLHEHNTYRYTTYTMTDGVSQNQGGKGGDFQQEEHLNTPAPTLNT